MRAWFKRRQLSFEPRPFQGQMCELSTNNSIGIDANAHLFAPIHYSWKIKQLSR
jgi:hypothetical protein